jgi:hypothetical protein
MKKIVERRYTRDHRCPRVAGDDEWLCGWQCIPLRPTNDDGWRIVDSSGDKKTGWERVRYVEDNDDRPVKYEQLKFDFLDR